MNRDYFFKDYLRAKLIDEINRYYLFTLCTKDEYNHILRHRIAMDTDCCTTEQMVLMRKDSNISQSRRLSEAELIFIQNTIDNTMKSFSNELNIT